MTLKQKLLIVGIAGLAVLVLDQSSKIWARSALLTPSQRQSLFAETADLYEHGELVKAPSGKRYRLHPSDPTRGTKKVRPVRRDGKRTFVPVVGDRPGTRAWFILSFNPGSAFGLFNETAGARVFLSVIGILALGLIFYLLKRPESDSKVFVWALALVAGGAVGNLIDRIAMGVVTDFIWVWLTPKWRMVWPWPAFNVADIALVVGVGLMIPAMLFTKADPDQDAKDADGKPSKDAASEGAGTGSASQASPKSAKAGKKSSGRRSSSKRKRR